MKIVTGSKRIVANAEGFDGKHWTDGNSRQSWSTPGFGLEYNPSTGRWGNPKQPKLYNESDEGKEEPMDRPYRSGRSLYE